MAFTALINDLRRHCQEEKMSFVGGIPAASKVLQSDTRHQRCKKFHGGHDLPQVMISLAAVLGAGKNEYHLIANGKGTEVELPLLLAVWNSAHCEDFRSGEKAPPVAVAVS